MKDIQKLLDSYFAGTSSREQEKLLKEYFSQKEIAEEYKIYQPLFQFFNTEQEIEFPIEAIPELAANKNKIVSFSFIKYLPRIAAVLLIGLAVWLIMPKSAQITHEQQAINWEQYEEKDPEIALEKTKAALMLLSSKMNKGAKKAAQAAASVEKVGNIFKEK